MTKLLEQAIAKLRQLPRERQDEAAELLLSLVEQDADEIQLTSSQISEIERRLATPSDYANHAEVRAFFRDKNA